MARREDWTSLEKSPVELHTIPKQEWVTSDFYTRWFLVGKGSILPLEMRPTLRLTVAERERYESQAMEQAAQCFHADQSDEYPCQGCVERYSRTLDQGQEKHLPCVNLAEPGQLVDYYA